MHLISGPLGTMAGLYESAIEWLCRMPDGRRPKIIASTATVRRAESQIRALFSRDQAEVFPPPGPDRRDSFFARTVPASEGPARLYCGVAAPGRSPKVALLRVYLALLTAAEKSYQQGPKSPANPADPYMTLLGYFNSLRELGGARRLISDEIRNRAQGYADRRRRGEAAGSFASRAIDYEPRELTSRIDTAAVAETKRRLSLPFSSKDAVDVAIATNMISVGLDIPRLGLMAVFGQPKTTAEYIQATSRVGRESAKPGLIVTIFNVHRPRDRSHYERFEHFHATFYRGVEAASVTPFSPRALDRGLAATLVGLARHGHAPMTPPRAAAQVIEERERLSFAAEVPAERAAAHGKLTPEDRERLRQRVRRRAAALLDLWAKLAQRHRNAGTGLQYNRVEAPGTPPLLYDFLEDIPPGDASPRFRANRSLRDVEPTVALWRKTLQNSDLEPEGTE
ncbi:MAG: helicase-related protein [Terriglobales bacterium]